MTLTKHQPLNQQQAKEADVWLLRITKRDRTFVWQVCRQAWLDSKLDQKTAFLARIQAIMNASMSIDDDPRLIEGIQLTGTWRETIWNVEGDTYDLEWRVTYPMAKEGIIIVLDPAMFDKFRQARFPAVCLATYQTSY